MNAARLVLFALLACFFTVCITFFSYQAYLYFGSVAQLETEYLFHISDTPGFDVEADKIRLGAVSSGMRARRGVTIEHESASWMRVTFSGLGSEVLYADPAKVYFVDGVATTLIVVAPHNGLPLGEYSGVVTFYLYE